MIDWPRLLHIVPAIGFVATQVMGDFVSRALRAHADWKARAALLMMMGRAAWVLGLAALVAAAVFGNLLAVKQGLRMAESNWLRAVNGLFVATLLVMALWSLPALGRLTRAARAAAASGAAPPDFDRLRARWFIGHSVVNLLYLITLALMFWRF